MARRSERSSHRTPWRVAGVALALFLALLPASPTAARTVGAALPDPIDFVNISATSNFLFAPSEVIVTPGSSVHLAVTQLADFAHTFVLSSLANYTLPSSANNLTSFFAAHPPLVDLNLGSTAGAVFFQNFSAPPVGTYEFVCTIHFAEGMVGEMHVGATSGPSSSPLLATEIGAGVGVVVVLVALGVFYARRRLARRPPPAQ